MHSSAVFGDVLPDTTLAPEDWRSWGRLSGKVLSSPWAVTWVLAAVSVREHIAEAELQDLVPALANLLLALPAPFEPRGGEELPGRWQLHPANSTSRGTTNCTIWVLVLPKFQLLLVLHCPFGCCWWQFQTRSTARKWQTQLLLGPGERCWTQTQCCGLHSEENCSGHHKDCFPSTNKKYMVDTSGSED